MQFGSKVCAGQSDHAAARTFLACVLFGRRVEHVARLFGHFHLGHETEQSVLFEALDPPEVDRAADLYADGVPAVTLGAR